MWVYVLRRIVYKSICYQTHCIALFSSINLNIHIYLQIVYNILYSGSINGGEMHKHIEY